MSDERLINIVEDLAAAVKHIDESQSKTNEVVSGIIQQVAENIERRAGARQDGMITQALLMSLIGALAKSGAVDASDVSARFLASAGSLDPQHQRQAELIADELAHPGFPDRVPPPRGTGPTLIVDND